MPRGFQTAGLSHSPPLLIPILQTGREYLLCKPHQCVKRSALAGARKHSSQSRSLEIPLHKEGLGKSHPDNASDPKADHRHRQSRLCASGVHKASGPLLATGGLAWKENLNNHLNEPSQEGMNFWTEERAARISVQFIMLFTFAVSNRSPHYTRNHTGLHQGWVMAGLPLPALCSPPAPPLPPCWGSPVVTGEGDTRFLLPQPGQERSTLQLQPDQPCVFQNVLHQLPVIPQQHSRLLQGL